MPRYIHPSGPIHNRYTNLSKGHKLGGVILVGGGGGRSLRSKGVEVPVYYLFHGYFPDVEFFA